MHIAFSSGLSKTYDCAVKSASVLNQKYGQKIYVVDSLCACSGHGFLGILASEYVEKAKENTDFKVDFNVTPHVFRHSKAVHMVRAGINLIYIRDFLGHVDCCTTEIYARIDTETKRNAIEKACKDIFPEEKTTDWTADEDLMSFLETLV